MCAYLSLICNRWPETQDTSGAETLLFDIELGNVFLYKMTFAQIQGNTGGGEL